jgi:hypothetical protein
LFLYQQKCKYSTESCKVCAGQVEVLDFSNPSEWLKNFCRKECAELEDIR